jgi:hypothetical protein
MARDIDLLPWILGGCLACGAAVMTAVALSAPQGSSGAAPQAAPSPAPAAAARSNDSSSDLSPVVISSNARQQLPSGQVWECEVNGQRVFSDVQCGAHATVRQLNDLNVMDSAAAPHPAYRYPYGAPYPSATSSAPPSYYPADEAPSDYSGDPYVGDQYLVVRDRNHRERRPPHLPARPHSRPHN